MEKCRRRWDLADAQNLKYRFMQVLLLPLLYAASRAALTKAYVFVVIVAHEPRSALL